MIYEPRMIPVREALFWGCASRLAEIGVGPTPRTAADPSIRSNWTGLRRGIADPEWRR
jgi:hypothetical protein